MSTLKVQTIQDVSGANSSAVSTLITGRITASACVDATGTANIRKSVGFSSVTDHAVGIFELHFSTAASDINYSYAGNAMKGDTNNDGNMLLQLGGNNTNIQKATVSFHERCKVATNNAFNDPEHFEVIVCQTD